MLKNKFMEVRHVFIVLQGKAMSSARNSLSISEKVKSLIKVKRKYMNEKSHRVKEGQGKGLDQNCFVTATLNVLFLEACEKCKLVCKCLLKYKSIT